MDRLMYHRDHWLHIGRPRLDRYERLYAWTPVHERLLAPAAIAPGHTVLDLGCGPGHVTVALARTVGDGGHVHAADISRPMIERAEANVGAAGLDDRVTFHCLDPDTPLPLPGASIDRVVAKEVFGFVTDRPGLLREVRRVLVPGGLLHAVEVDWGFVVLQPLDPVTITEVVLAAAPVWSEPFAGRRLPAIVREAGFGEVAVAVDAQPDATGTSLPIVHDLADDILALHTMREGRVQGLLQEIDLAIEEGTYLFVLPNFLVTAGPATSLA